MAPIFGQIIFVEIYCGLNELNFIKAACETMLAFVIGTGVGLAQTNEFPKNFRVGLKD